MTHSEDAASPVDQARALIHQGKPREARMALTVLTPETLADPAVRLLLAEARLYEGDLPTSIDEARVIADEACAEGLHDLECSAAAVSVLAHLRTGGGEDIDRAQKLIDRAKARLFECGFDAKARVLHAEAVLLLRRGNFEDARKASLAALGSAKGAGDRWRSAMIQDSLGIVHAHQGDGRRALKYFDDSLAIKRDLGDIYGQAITHGSRGRVYLREAENEQALEEFERDASLAREAGDDLGVCIALDQQAMALMGLSRLDEAEGILREALAICSPDGKMRYAKQVALCKKDLALVEERRGRNPRSLELLAEAEAIFREQNNPDGCGYCLLLSGKVHRKSHHPDQALDCFKRALADIRKSARHDLEADILIQLAELEEEDGQEQESRVLLEEAKGIALREGLRPLLHHIQGRLQPDAQEMPKTLLVRNPLGIGRADREFFLYELIAEGGQGKTWRALDVSCNRVVVLKECQLDMESNDALALKAQQWQTELAAASRVDHPAVVRMYGYHRESRTLALIMEYLEGDNLRKVFDAGRLGCEAAWKIVSGMAEGLDALHDAGVLHRDIKPENVVLRADGSPVIVDLGLAALSAPGRPPDPDDDSRGASAQLGTLGYMAPEQFQGASNTVKSDLFAFGLITLEMFSGVNPLLPDREDIVVGDYYRLLMDRNSFDDRIDSALDAARLEKREHDAVRRLLTFHSHSRPATAAEFLSEAR